MHTHLWLGRGGPRRAVMVGLALILAALLGTACDVGTSGAGTSPGGATPPPVPTALVRGEAVFTRYCQVCHPGGDRGVGARLIGTPLSDDQIKAVVRNGQKNMPAFSPDTIPDDDLQSLVKYIRALK